MFSRKLQCERQRPLTFQDRCEELTGLRDKIQEESRKPQSFCSHQEVLSFHQVLHTPNNNKDEQEPEPDTSLIICFFYIQAAAEAAAATINDYLNQSSSFEFEQVPVFVSAFPPPQSTL